MSDRRAGKRQSFDETADALPSFQNGLANDPALRADIFFGLEKSSFDRQSYDPQTMDWRNRINAPLVRRQGKWNSCLSCASVATVEARRQIGNHPARLLSPGFLHSCIGGIHTSEEVPFYPKLLDQGQQSGMAISNDQSFPVDATTCAISERARYTSHRWVTGIEAILDDLNANGPLIAVMLIDGDFARHTGSAIYGDGDPDRGTQRHAVIVLGYDLPSNFAIIQNSMGTDWGVEGIGRIRIGTGGLLTRRSGIAISI